MRQQVAAGWCEGQIGLNRHHEVELGRIIGEPSSSFGRALELKAIGKSDNRAIGKGDEVG
jgi:hypothetical protein